MTEFVNDDKRLLERVDQARQERRDAGLEGLVGGLETVIINVRQEDLPQAVEELLRYTGLDFLQAWEDDAQTACLLQREGCADFIVKTRKSGPNPFVHYNTGPKSEDLPDNRLETFVYRANDLERYVTLQQTRGVRFLTQEIQRTPTYSFIQTEPSRFTGNSLGFIQWHGKRGQYLTDGCAPLDWKFPKPALAHLRHIMELDHSATRVRAPERDDAIIEFMLLTNYDFAFAVYVESLNSITNVARLSLDDYAQVFTSGIKPFESLETSGPTERFIHNFGLRVHHLAFNTSDIDATFQALKDDGMGFLLELVGSREEGLKQTFSQMSPHTFLVNEYIHRYDGFDGFFTKSNVTELTRATEKQ